jgi:hypothetical protein
MASMRDLNIGRPFPPSLRSYGRTGRAFSLLLRRQMELLRQRLELKKDSARFKSR